MISTSGWWFQPTTLKNHGQLVSWGPMTFPIFLESHIAAMFQSPPISQSMYCQ